MQTKDQKDQIEKDQIEKVFRNNESLCHHRDDGVNVVASEIEDGYLVTYHKGEMPAFAVDRYTNLEQVIEAMRNLAPLAQWKTIEEEEDKGGKEKMGTVHYYVYERDDSLLSDIIKTIAKNEEGPRVRKLDNGIRVYTRNSQRPELNFNGGDYDHYTNFLVEDDGHVVASEGWSSDFDYGCTHTVVYGMHTVTELHAIADSLVMLVEIIEQELRNRLS